jgi:hypothetical protein
VPVTFRSSLVALAGTLALAVHATPASAVIASLRSGAAVSFQPLPGSGARTSAQSRSSVFDAYFSNVDYNGGPVMASNRNYAIFWRPPGAAPEYPAGYKSGLERFFEDLAHDSGGHENVDSVAAQYNDASGQFASYSSQFGGGLTDEHPYPSSGCTRAPKCLTGEQIRTELVRFVKEKGLPTDLGHEYFLLTPEGVESCFEAAGSECSANVAEAKFQKYCAYHGNIPLSGGGELIYSNDPFVNGKHCDEPNHPNGSSDSALIGGLSHEHIESITDPEPNSAWTDFGSSSVGEVGDKCGLEYGTPLGIAKDGAEYNQLINGHEYWYQEEWSNKGTACLQHLSFKASDAPVAAFTSTEAPSGEIKFNAAGSSSGEGDRYNWQWNDRPYPENIPFETKELQTWHFFPEAGVYTVALTVFKADGTSYGTAKNVSVRGTQTIGFTSTPPSGATAGGSPYTVSASSSSGLPVTLAIDPSSVSVCSISERVVSFVGAGSCTIDASQDGSAEFAPAAVVQQSFAVAPRASVSSSTPSPPPPPGSSFMPLAAVVNPKTGVVTLTEWVFNPGTFSWLLTFPNGRFGAFAARAKCKPGFLAFNGRCRPARVVFASGSRALPARVAVSFTVRPSRAALKALKTALKQRRSLPVRITLTFQAAGGGTPVSQTQSVSVRPRK